MARRDGDGRRRRLAAGLGLLALLGGIGWVAVRDPWPVVATIPRGYAGLGFGPDGRTYRTTGAGTVAWSWDLATGRREAGPTWPIVGEPVRSPDGRLFAGAVEPEAGDSIELAWGDLDSGAIRGRRAIPSRPMAPVAWQDGGQSIRALVRPPTAECAAWSWDLATGATAERPVWGPREHGGVHLLIAVADDGRTLAYFDGADRCVRPWDADADGPLGPPIPAGARDANDTPPGVAFAPGGRFLALAGPDGRVEAWDVRAGRRVGGRSYPPPRHRLGRRGDVPLAIAPDGGVLAVEVADVDPPWIEEIWDRIRRQLDPQDVRLPHGVDLIDAKSGRLLGRAVGASQPEFSPDGRWVVVRGCDGTTAVRANPRPPRPGMAPADRR